eukprot:237871-Rhodomonas_salina.2
MPSHSPHPSQRRPHTATHQQQCDRADAVHNNSLVLTLCLSRIATPATLTTTEQSITGAMPSC